MNENYGLYSYIRKLKKEIQILKSRLQHETEHLFECKKHDLKMVSHKTKIEAKYICDCCNKIINCNFECPAIMSQFLQEKFLKSIESELENSKES